MIRFECSCGTKLKAPESQQGRDFDCPKCGNKVSVPVAISKAESSVEEAPDVEPQTPVIFGDLESNISLSSRVKNEKQPQSGILKVVAFSLLAIVPSLLIFAESRKNSAAIAVQLAEFKSRLLELEKQKTSDRPAEIKLAENIKAAEPKKEEKPPIEVTDAQIVNAKADADAAAAALNAKREKIQAAQKQVEIEQRRVDDIYIRLGLLNAGELHPLTEADRKAQRGGEEFYEAEIRAGANFPGPVSEAIRKQLKRDVDKMVNRVIAAGGRFSRADADLCSRADVPMPDEMREQLKTVGENSGIRVRKTDLENAIKQLKELELELNN